MAPSRRDFLLGAGSIVLLAACGDDSGSTEPTTTAGGDTSAPSDLPDSFEYVQRIPTTPLLTPGPVRLPVSLSDGQNILTSGPATIAGRIENEAGATVADITALRRDASIEIPYWEVRADLPEVGIYVLRLDGGVEQGMAFQVWDPAEVLSPVTGTKLPPFNTPTVDDHRGVEPYCSLTPEPCPLHEITLTEALATGTPVVYMVGTPAHCQTGTCAPGLEFLVAEHERLGDAVAMVHADVYADDAATRIAPAVDELKVDYEPIIYFTDASGTVVDRLDAVWDAAELRERLDLLLKA